MRLMQLRPGFHWYKPYFNLGYFCIGSGLAYQIYLAFRCTKASTSLITSHINNTYAQILKCATHAISFKGNHYNPTLATFKILGRHSPYKIFSKNFIHLIYMQKVCQNKYILKLFYLSSGQALNLRP